METLEMNSTSVNPKFWESKKVFLTGHSGFKGSWLSLWLSSMGAKVTGFSLPPSTYPNLYNELDIEKSIFLSCFEDIRNLEALQSKMRAAKPDIVIHMAAQPLVRQSYLSPVETYSINVMGTVHLLEAVRFIDSVRATIIVTTDKCYENKEWAWGYRENEPMGGFDPYSNSKGCAELVTSAFRISYFSVDNFS
jgi:CDP-glucose 4,6-dehydratase